MVTFHLERQHGLNTLVSCQHTAPEVRIPETVGGCRVEAIGKGLFLNDTQLESVFIPDTVLQIGDSAFQGSALKNIRFPSALQTIGIFALADCDSLAAVSLPDTLRIISYGCFSVCTALSYVHLPKQLLVIANRAFEECRSLSEIAFPEGLTEIGNAAFYNCPALSAPKLPHSLTSVGHSAFYSSPSICPACDTVELPPSVELVGARAFRCHKLIVPGNTDLDAISNDIRTICAPNTDPSSFTQSNTLYAACAGFAEMVEQNVPIRPVIADAYYALITENHRDLYPLTAHNSTLLRYLLRMEIVPADEVHELIDLCAGQTEDTALLLQYSKEMSRFSLGTLTLEDNERL